jgi:integrase
MAKEFTTDREHRTLTVSAIKALKYRGRQTAGGSWTRRVVWDTEVRGLGVRVYPSEQKYFLVSYRQHGRKRLISLGQVGAITLHQARAEARDLLGTVRHGEDPLADRQRDRAAGTIRELCDRYLHDYAKPRKKSWKKDESYIDRFIVPRWGNVKAKAITTKDIADLHHELGIETKYQANRVLEVIKSIFTYAIKQGYLDPGQSNPALGIPAFKEQSRKRRLDFNSELSRVLKAIDDEEDVFVRTFFWLLILTGCRKSELLSAKWGDIRWDPPTLVLPQTKSGESQEKELSEEAVALLRELYDYADHRTMGNPYVFVGRQPGRPLVNVDKPWSRIRKRAGVEDVRIHDIRRSVGSWLADEGHSLHLIRDVLHHKSSKTTETYARLSDDTRRRALEAQAKRIRAVAGKTKAPVVPLRDLRRSSGE